MNLLNDQWERQQGPTSGDPLKSSPAFQLVGEDQLAAGQDFSFPEEEQDLESGNKKRKSFAASFLLIFALLSVVAAAVYFGYFNKKLPKLPFANLFTKTEAKIDTAITQIPTAVQPESVYVKTESDTGTVAATQAENVVEETPPVIVLCARNLDILLSAQPPDVRIATLILDETSFSVEVLSRTRQSAESFYGSLKDQLKGEVMLSPSSGTAETARTLISGSFSASSSSPAVDKSVGLSKEQLRSRLLQISNQTGTKLVEFAVGENVTSLGITKAPVFVKVSGSLPQCQSFFSQMAQEGKNLRVAKIILMAGNPQQASLVARLELLQSA